MQLIGSSFTDAPPPLREGFVPLAGVTAIVGRNDTGKTSLLRNLQQQLDERSEDSSRGPCTFFVSCSEVEADLLVRLATSDLRQSQAERSVPPRTFRPRRGADFAAGTLPHRGSPPNQRAASWRLGVWSGEALDSVELAPDSHGRIAWLRILRDTLDERSVEQDWLLDQLAASRLFALAKDYAGRPEEGWDLYWCLDRDTDGGCLSRTGLRHFGPELDTTRPELRVPSAPVIAAPVGVLVGEHLPTPMQLPTDSESLTSELVSLTDRVVFGRRNSPHRATNEDESVLITEPDGSWIEEDQRAEDVTARWARIHPLARETVAAVERRLRVALPSFVPYEIVIRTELAYDSGVNVAVALFEPGGDSGFPLSSLAQGYQIWVQLALLQVIGELRRYVKLGEAYEDTIDQDISQDRLDFLADLEDSPDDEVEKVYWQHHIAPLDAVLSVPADRFRAAEIVEQIEDRPGAVNWDFARVLEASRPQLIVVDEPERHLHPRLQRHAIRWLSEYVAKTGYQALVATHSPALFELGPEVELVRLIRGERGPAVLSPVPKEDRFELGGYTDELGLDRGELNTRTKVLLWVEGIHEQVVFRSLFPDELWRYGVEVLPFHGSDRSIGVLAAKQLMRTNARSAVLFDNIPEDVREGLHRDPDYVQVVLKDPPTPEARSAARLVAEAHRLEADVQILSHPHADVWDLLDDEIVESWVREKLGPGQSYSHQAAGEEWRKQLDAGKWKVSQRKRFLAEQLGLTEIDAAVLGGIATRMAEAGRRPSELRAVIDECARLSFEVE